MFTFSQDLKQCNIYCFCTLLTGYLKDRKPFLFSPLFFYFCVCIFLNNHDSLFVSHFHHTMSYFKNSLMIVSAFYERNTCSRSFFFLLVFIILLTYIFFSIAINCQVFFFLMNDFQQSISVNIRYVT